MLNSGYQDTITTIAFSPDGEMIASASLDKTIKLWTENGELIWTLPGHNIDTTGVAFFPISLNSNNRQQRKKII